MGWLAAIVAVLGAALWGPAVSQVEQAPYTVAEQHGSIEIRDYAASIVAEARERGEREAAINAGFRTIADYIFGNNLAPRDTAPGAAQAQQQSATIAMTAPVTQQAAADASWRVRFVMPARYTLASLPTPRNPAVQLLAVPARRCAVIRFAGRAGAASLEQHTQELQDFLATRHLVAQAPPIYAFYNPPWTLPFLRRNEILIEIGGS